MRHRIFPIHTGKDPAPGVPVPSNPKPDEGDKGAV